MNKQRWLFASLAGFLVLFVLDFIIHGKLLRGLYQETASIWRGHGQNSGHELMWLMVLGQFVFSALFAWIYTKGYEPSKPGMRQGLRYGFMIGLLTSVTYISVWYVVLPIPLILAKGWVLGNLIDCCAAGAVVGAIYHK